jgi:hypothetical protein
VQRPTTITYKDGRICVLCYCYVDLYVDKPPTFERCRRFKRAWIAK